MVMTMLLSIPAIAAAADGVKPGPASVEPMVDGNANQASEAKANVAASSATRIAMKTATPDRVTSHISSVTRSHEIAPVVQQGVNGRIIRRTNASGPNGAIDRNLIDDGTLWREHGSVATWQQTGMASWYGGARWQGQRTTSGSHYDQNALTAAHATLPLGTKVRVTSHSGARSVIVTINDRPGTRTRIIDLSRQAAKELGILDAGVAMVTLHPM